METFLFSIISDLPADTLELEPCPACAVTESMWAELAAQIACEPASIPYPPATLAQRAEEGYAAAAIWQGHVVSHVALIPIGCRTGSPGAPHTWAAFCATSGFHTGRLPSVDLYQFSSGWTAQAWRRKRINMALRKRLLAHYMGDRSLGVGGMAGLAQPLLAQLGWQILAWSATPFVSSLVGVPVAGLEDCVPAGWRPPRGLARYEGPPIGLDDPAHPWSQFCYFWVSDAALAYELDGQLAELCQGDLCQWRRAILDVFSRPGALCMPALLP